VSNIPFTAISAALDPVQRQTNESLRAHRVQSQKNIHHNEDVEELDDAAVNSIHDQSQKESSQEQEEEEGEAREKVDIESLKMETPKPAENAASSSLSHLDISA